MHSKICVVFDRAGKPQGDLMELRADRLEVGEFWHLFESPGRPKLLTLRSDHQGGGHVGGREELLALARLQPDYLDLEFPHDVDQIVAIREIAPRTQLLLSYHGEVGSFPDLWRELRRFPVDLYKIACPVDSTVQALELLKVARDAQKEAPLIVVGMGEQGQATRILAGKVGMPFTFSYPDGGQPAAPGQLSFSELVNRYGFYRVGPQTEASALIGQPVKGSLGHRLHNRIIQELDLPSTYLKMEVRGKDLERLLSLVRELDFRGLSVTMPHKEAVIPQLAGGDPSAGAVNTLVRGPQGWEGWNTDGYGALKSLGSVRDREVLLLGAGGAARGIAQAMQIQGARLKVWNRHPERAERLVQDIGGVAVETLPEACDILLNTLPALVAPPQVKAKVFLDINLRKGGAEMFLQQALAQVRHWWGIEVKPAFEGQLRKELQKWLSE